MNNSNSSKKAASVGQDPNRVHVHTFCWEVQSKAPNIYQLSKPPGVLWKMQLSEERQKSGLVVAWGWGWNREWLQRGTNIFSGW